MKAYIHARLSQTDRAVLKTLQQSTGHSESELVRRGLRLVLNEVGRSKGSLDLAGRSVGKFRGGPKDLARNKKHLHGFGE
jgi:hypothetical protein